jgi:hypothetical protein
MGGGGSGRKTDGRSGVAIVCVGGAVCRGYGIWAAVDDVDGG